MFHIILTIEKKINVFTFDIIQYLYNIERLYPFLASIQRIHDGPYHSCSADSCRENCEYPA